MSFRSFSILSSLLLTFGLTLSSAEALVRLDQTNINIAIKYGIQNQGSLANVLGPNWIEGENGVLVNVYSPFMLIASMAAKKGALDDSPQSVKDVRKKMTRVISYNTDPNEPQQVKFATALMGNSPDFANHVKARIEGMGRGKSVSLRPIKSFYDKVADLGVGVSGKYDGVNAYYFYYKDLENLDRFQFILTSPDGETVINIDNHNLY